MKIQLQIASNKTECADIKEALFYCDITGNSEHKKEVLRVHRLATVHPLKWCDNYTPFLTAQRNVQEVIMANGLTVVTSGEPIVKNHPVFVSVRITL